MPAYTHLRTFINALKSGRTHITDCLDEFFRDPAAVQGHARWAEFSAGNWSAGAPSWLGAFFDEIGLTSQERDHVLCYPAGELEKTRAAAAAATAANQLATFRWGLYDGNAPRATVHGGHRIRFESPGESLRLTSINYGEVYVEEV
jgi:hypothetical protein